MKVSDYISIGAMVVSLISLVINHKLNEKIQHKKHKERITSCLFDDILLKGIPEYLYCVKNNENVTKACNKMKQELIELNKFCTVLYFTDLGTYKKIRSSIEVIDELIVEIKGNHSNNERIGYIMKLEKEIQKIYDNLKY